MRSRIAVLALVVLALVVVALGYRSARPVAQMVAGAGAQNHAAQQTPVPPAFRAGVVLVPVDVRVVDADGKPVTDLTAADFTVFENGVRQQIAHFSTQSYLGPLSPDTTVAAPPPRTFFIVLGRGRLNGPTKALDGVIDFIRNQLRPDDHVGLLAYLHLVEPTTDQAAVARLLERYLAQHEGIEDKLTRDGRRGVGAPSWPLLLDTQQAIAALFDAPGLPAVQHVPDAEGGSEIDFHSLVYFRRSLEYLRYVEGEKNLIVVLDNVLPLGRDGDAMFAARAASARVRVFVIQAGGLEGSRPATNRFDSPPSQTNVLAARQYGTLADLTGGHASLYQHADATFARLVRVTSFQYLLGYYPIRPPRDGEYRTLRVVVNRRGVTAQYRHAYEAQPPVQEPMDLRRIFVRSSILRLASMPQSRALGVPGVSPYGSNIPMKLSPAVTHGPADDSHVSVSVAIDPNFVTVTREGDQTLISLDVAAFVRDPESKVLSEEWGHIDLKLDATGYARLKKERIRHTFSLTVTGRPSQVVVVVYEYESNRGRWATAKLR